MLFALSDAAWRVVLLFALGLAPAIAPPEAIGARTPAVAWVRLVIALILAIGLTLAARRMARPHPLAALSAALALIGVPIASAYFSGDRGPLLRGAWIAAPLVWAAVTSVLAGPVAARLTRSVRPRVARRTAVGVTTLGIASIAFAYPILSSRAAMWNRALKTNPGDENAARAVAAVARARGDRLSSLETFSRCRLVKPKSCGCAEEAAADAIDLGRYIAAREALDATITCERSGYRMALTAEALIGTRELEAGLRDADLALAQNPDAPHAVYARAWGTYLKGNAKGARADAERAVKLGRGAPARLLYGLLLYTAGDLDAATSEFRGVLAEEPDSAQATYDLALIAQKRNQYREAREGYLRALKLDPQMADARYNLVVLTQGLGATMEAQHHLDEFVTAFPKDPRIPSLLQLLATPAPRRAMTVGQ